MEKKFITQEQKDRAYNRVVLNFGVLLAGALVLLYTYNFYASGWYVQLYKVLRTLGYIFAALAVVMFGASFTKKFRKVRSFAAIPFGAFIATLFLIFLPDSYNSYNAFRVTFGNLTHRVYDFRMATLVVCALMVLYFVVLAVYTAIYLKTHPVSVEKKKIQHKKKRK